MKWSTWIADKADQIKRAKRWRELQVWELDRLPMTLKDREDGGGSLISFAANDYLGLSQHPDVINAAHAALDRWGTGATSARFAVGTRPYHLELEESLAKWKKSEKAILFPTGYVANLGVLSALGGPEVIIVSDELNHASIIDGCRLSKAEVLIYRHNDAEHAAQLLESALKSGYQRSVIVTDLVFSMDGDIAPVADLVRLCQRFGSILVLDEAHSVLGPELDHKELDGIDVLRVGTLSKMLGSLGGFVAGRKEYTELLMNLARPFRFTTASTPADVSAALAALNVFCSPEGQALRMRLQSFVDQLRPGHKSAIIPIILGSEDRTLSMSASLLDHGFIVPAIIPPVVPVGTSRLRLALSAAHTADQISDLKSMLENLIP